MRLVEVQLANGYVATVNEPEAELLMASGHALHRIWEGEPLSEVAALDEGAVATLPVRRARKLARRGA